MKKQSDLSKSGRHRVLIANLPEFKYYLRTYGQGSPFNDQKMARVFREFESKERLRRFQRELSLVKNGSVSEKICDQIIGKKRKARFHNYRDWAVLMLLWLSEGKR